MARPKKADDTRTEQVNLRLTVEEKQCLHERATGCGLTPTDYARRVMFGVPMAFKEKSDPALIVALNRIGVNLNQMTRVFNSGSQVPPFVLTEILQSLSVLLDKMQRLDHLTEGQGES